MCACQPPGFVHIVFCHWYVTSCSFVFRHTQKSPFVNVSHKAARRYLLVAEESLQICCHVVFHLLQGGALLPKRTGITCGNSCTIRQAANSSKQTVSVHTAVSFPVSSYSNLQY